MRAIVWLGAVYLAVAVATRLAEAAGVHRCGCASDCWCHRRILDTFRWVFPFGHRSIGAAEKERRESGARPA